MTLQLPIAYGITKELKLDLKRDSRGMSGWETFGTAKWDASNTPQDMSISYGTGHSDAIKRFYLRVRTPADGTVILNLNIEGTANWARGFPAYERVVIPGGDCKNVWVGDNDDVEYDHGKNNNGWQLDFIVGSRGDSFRLWPKREDRIRFEVRRRGAEDLFLEFDAKEFRPFE